MKQLLISILTIITLNSNATTYYISASGNDANAGTSTGAPWKTLAKITASSFSSGDNILFNRGDVFYGSLTIHNSGSSGNPITLGAYGSGANPGITGFTTVSSWSNLGGGGQSTTGTASVNLNGFTITTI